MTLAIGDTYGDDVRGNDLGAGVQSSQQLDMEVDKVVQPGE